MKLNETLEVALPIIQAPMAGVQDSALAVSVSNAGGLGSLPCAMLDDAGLEKQLSLIQSQTSSAFNVNFFAHTPPAPNPDREQQWLTALQPYYDELGIDIDSIPTGAQRLPFREEALAVIAKFKPKAVSFHFGLPEKYFLDEIRGWGGKILSTATTISEAQWLEDKNVDAIIVQGIEAGGHRGHFLSGDLNRQLGLFALLPQVAQKVSTPLIATGGIADSAGVAAALKLGASMVQVGTSYLLCTEATTSAIHRAALKSGDARLTAVTNLFTGRPARGIINRLMRELGPISELAPEFPLAAAAIAPLRTKSESMGKGDFSPLWTGSNISGCREISAGELTGILADI